MQHDTNHHRKTISVNTKGQSPQQTCPFIPSFILSRSVSCPSARKPEKAGNTGAQENNSAGKRCRHKASHQIAGK